MKKYIKQIATFALIAAMASCSSDDDVDYTSVGGNAVPKASITRLDTNFNLPITLYTKEGVTATKIEIYQNAAKTTADPTVLGAKVSDATIGTDGTATFNTSTLGSFDVFPVTANGVTTLTGKTGVFNLVVVSTYSDGSKTQAIYTLTVGKGIVWKVLDADGLPKTTNATSGVSSVGYLDPAPVNIYYATVKNGTTVIDKVDAEWSFDDGVTFSAIPGLVPSKTTQTINLADLDYVGAGVQADDEVVFRFTVTSGTQTDAITTKIVYSDQIFDAAKGGSLSNSDTTSQFSFADGLNYDSAGTANAEITFVAPFGFKRTSDDVRILFVRTPLDFDATNLFEAEAAFNSGVKVSQVTGLNTNETVLYKVTRNVNLGTTAKPDFQDVTYYGLIKITDHVAGTTSQKLSFSYEEGVLYQEPETTPVVINPAP
ncbi:hypothetical protein [Flavobacterium pectinovorum]|uniref:DUF5018 domain-containing protein n=1 Tax=Flavobacterium pectinovorum TaxID=29533 RepID=A0AB36P5B8_9FLAO|nr:hypothetical protein [Flavobacterium pectinovorum]OXB07530.1 hypothetical protein B0A72_01315 [Flavobacterium pectinovorum]SHM70762.1 hypothetical protein SAMN05444387_2968 [Flavobacterium pectinovorum]